jgi:hypothetical protein
MTDQLAKGAAAETQLDRHFADRFHITPATRAQQRQGIDRHFTHRQSGATYTIEYKTDWTAARTGNAFVETVSVDSAAIPGWVYTSQAEWLAYFLPDHATIYLLAFPTLRACLPQWGPPAKRPHRFRTAAITPWASWCLCLNSRRSPPASKRLDDSVYSTYNKPMKQQPKLAIVQPTERHDP